MKNKTLIDLIIDQYERTQKWNNVIAGNSSYRINEKDYEELGREYIISQARELEERGLVKIVWVKGFRGFDIEKVIYPLCNMDCFCKTAEREPKYLVIARQLQLAQECYSKISTPWIRKYMKSEVFPSLEKGKVADDTNKVDMQYKCLEGLDSLDSPIFKRVFSKRFLKNSKEFERKFQSFIIRIARKYSEDIDEAMEDSDVLNQIYIEEYSQELSIKGSLRIELEHNVIDTGIFRFGTVLNTQTLKNAVILENPQIKKILTIENKANFVAESYEEGTLILFTHGFFTPTEKTFLKNLYGKIQNQEVVYRHCGDMDYGGVCIFKYIKNKIFPELRPYKMDVATFKAYINYAEPITDSCLEKLKAFEEPLLKDIIEFIIETREVLEQEAYL